MWSICPENVAFDAVWSPLLDRKLAGNPSNSICMTRLFDMDDRARLRERFFGATHTVLARL